jgi:glycosyltransferase involved in cell wall biosynthesis
VDILHCTGNTAPYFSAVPVVQTLHDVIFMDSIPTEDSFYQRFGNHYRRKVVPLITPRSKAVITVSRYEKERIVDRLGIDPEKIHVIYNGINEERFNRNGDVGDQKSILEKYQLPDDFILFLGNQSSRKNPARVIEAYVKYATQSEKPMALVTPGLCDKFVADKCKDLNYRYDKRQFITPGYIDDADLPEIYRCSKIFLFPSLSEGFGMPIIEAMACGTPVITSQVSCMPEIAGKAGVLVDPLNISDISEAILSLAGNEELRNKKIQAGLINTKRFSWTQSAKKILSLYEAVVEQTKSVPTFAQKQVYAQRH